MYMNWDWDILFADDVEVLMKFVWEKVQRAGFCFVGDKILAWR